MFEIPCRTCLSQQSLKQLDESFTGEQSKSVYDFLICWPPTQNIRRDHKICSACIEKISAFHKFQLQVNRANRAFSEFYENTECALPNEASIKLEVNEVNDSTDISNDTTLMTPVKVEKIENILDEINHTLIRNKNETDLKRVVDLEDNCGKTIQNPPTIVQIKADDIASIKDERSEENQVEDILTTDVVESAGNFINAEQGGGSDQTALVECSAESDSEFKIDITEHKLIVEIPNSESVCNNQLVDSLSNAHGQCDICRNEVPSSSLSRPLQTLEKVGEKQYCCDACKINFQELDTKIKREKRKKRAQPISKMKSQCCDLCGRKFAPSTNLTNHKRIHNGEKPYGCDLCGRKFTHSSSLTSHKRTHSGDKPYGCEVCGREFALSTNLTRHKRTHNGEKPYGCDICGRKFVQSTNLTKHKRIHNGEKPYGCDVCGRKFSRSDNLTVHKRKHNRE